MLLYLLQTETCNPFTLLLSITSSLLNMRSEIDGFLIGHPIGQFLYSELFAVGQSNKVREPDGS